MNILTFMNDILIRGITQNGHFRIAFARHTQLTEKARQIHNTSPVATIVMSRFIGGALLLSTGLKEKEQYSFYINCEGEITGISADVNHAGKLRVYPRNPFAHVIDENGKPDISTAIGNGVFTSTKWQKDQKEPYTSQIELVYRTIAKDFSYYLTSSEQIPSAVVLGEYLNRDGSIACAGGLMIQAMPDAEPNEIGFLETTVEMKPTLVEMLLEDFSIPMILDKYLGIMGYEIFTETEPEYVCTCNREKVERSLISLGKQELTELLHQEKSIETYCEYCHNQYVFTQHDIADLISQIEK